MKKITFVFCVFYTINIYFVQALQSGFGEECNSSDKLCDLKAFLVCDSKSLKCSCKDSKTNFYDPKDKMCKVLSGEDCKADAGAQPCVANAACAPKKGEGEELECECFPHLESVKGQCFLPIGGDCTGNSGSCDKESFVECKNGKCTCAGNTNALYESSIQSCVLGEGSPCSTEDGQQTCVKPLVCDEKTGTCKNGGSPRKHLNFEFIILSTLFASVLSYHSY